ncbi:hypothetical protein ACLOJK_004718, partial [Asimina triloba]
MEVLVEMDLERVQTMFGVEWALVESAFASRGEIEVVLVVGVVIKVFLGEVNLEVRVRVLNPSSGMSRNFTVEKCWGLKVIGLRGLMRSKNGISVYGGGCGVGCGIGE